MVDADFALGAFTSQAPSGLPMAYDLDPSFFAEVALVFRRKNDKLFLISGHHGGPNHYIVGEPYAYRR
jgi:hypothetical protein